MRGQSVKLGAALIPVEGVVKEETVGDGKSKKKAKVLRKIPPEVIREAKGVAIFTSMRSGFAPLGGAGGAGVVVARLPDGCECLMMGGWAVLIAAWSGPASISPNNLSTGVSPARPSGLILSSSRFSHPDLSPPTPPKPEPAARPPLLVRDRL